MTEVEKKFIGHARIEGDFIVIIPAHDCSEKILMPLCNIRRIKFVSVAIEED